MTIAELSHIKWQKKNIHLPLEMFESENDQFNLNALFVSNQSIIIWLFTIGNWLSLPFWWHIRKRAQMIKINFNYSFFCIFISIFFFYCCRSVLNGRLQFIHFHETGDEINLFRVTNERCGMCQALKATISAFQFSFFSEFFLCCPLPIFDVFDFSLLFAILFSSNV